MNCKIPKIEDDLKNKIHYNWDAISFNGNLLEVYCIPGFPHSIGGIKGINELYCCLRDETLSIDNIMQFSGESCKWDLYFESNNFLTFKYEKEIIHNYVGKIYRNNNLFYKFSSSSIDYLMAKSKILMTEIYEGPIHFSSINYENEIIGREINFKKIPCIIDSYKEGENLEIKPTIDNIAKFINVNKIEPGDDIYVMEDLFSSNIDWFRD